MIGKSGYFNMTSLYILTGLGKYFLTDVEMADGAVLYFMFILIVLRFFPKEIIVIITGLLMYIIYHVVHG